MMSFCLFQDKYLIKIKLSNFPTYSIIYIFLQKDFELFTLSPGKKREITHMQIWFLRFNNNKK